MYDELRRLQNEEKVSNKLSPVDKDIYVRTFDYINNLKNELAKRWDTRKMREFENCEKVMNDIEKRRVEKILIYAFNEVYNGFDPAQNLSKEEEILSKKVKECVVQFKRMISKKEGATDEHNESEEKNEEGIIKIKLLKDVPKFKSVNGDEYGPFTIGSVCKIPKTEGEIMIKRNIAIPA